MTGECKNYLDQKLRAAGINEVYQTAEQGQKHHSLPYALVSADAGQLSGHERLEYSPRRVAMENDLINKVRRVRWRTHIRHLQLRVAIVHRTEAEAEAALTAFLADLDRRFLDAGGNAVLVNADVASRNDDGSLLRSQAGAEAVIFFQGGVYRDEQTPLFSVPETLALEPEMTQEV